ncbi:MAG TPA: glycosyltransferase, partial [Methylophilus sp.]
YCYIMWILHICHSYYPPFLDCARQYAALFKGTAYKVLTVYLTGNANADVVAGSESDEVLFLGYESHQVSGLKIKAILDIRALTKQREFAFCITHRVKPTYVALLATNLPVVSVHHNYNDYQRWSRRILVNVYQSRLLMLGVSDSVRDDLRRDLKGWDVNRIQTLYNRINVEATVCQLLNKSEARKKLALPEDAWVVANVGRLHHDKDQATLIRGFALALPALPCNSLLAIVGDGPLATDLKQLVAELNIGAHVLFLGKVSNAKQYFKAFDVFALTSDHEPFGMVLLEAMAAELPIICSNSGGGAEVVAGIGRLFILGNEQSLSEALQEASHDGGLSKNSKHALLERYSDTAVREQFWSLAVIQQISSRLPQ